MTVDDVMQALREKHEAEIQAALDWQANDGGEVVFSIGINRRAKEQIDAEAKAEAMKPENLLAEIEALKAAIGDTK